MANIRLCDIDEFVCVSEDLPLSSCLPRISSPSVRQGGVCSTVTGISQGDPMSSFVIELGSSSSRHGPRGSVVKCTLFTFTFYIYIHDAGRRRCRHDGVIEVTQER